MKQTIVANVDKIEEEKEGEEGQGEKTEGEEKEVVGMLIHGGLYRWRENSLPFFYIRN